MIEYLTVEDLLTLVADLGVGPVHDVGLLEAAAHRPTAVVWGEEAYPTIDDKAAALMDSIVRNHPLVDGNKRLGWLSVYVFYHLNDVNFPAPDDEAYDVVIDVATGSADPATVAATFREWRLA